MATSNAHAGVIAPPPLIFFGFLFAGWGLGTLLNEPSFGLDTAVRRGAALGGLAVGLLIEGMAVSAMRRLGTAPEPWKATTALAVDGVFRLSRNPIYVGFAVTYLGLAVGLDSPVALGLIVPCLFVIDRFVIRREERYLAALFGAPYDAYCAKVRRWL